MVRAFLMVSVAAGDAADVLTAVREVDAVVDAHVIAGGWDLVVELEADSVRDLLGTVTREIRSLDGVGTTRCYVSLD